MHHGNGTQNMCYDDKRCGNIVPKSILKSQLLNYCDQYHNVRSVDYNYFSLDRAVGHCYKLIHVDPSCPFLPIM